MVDQSPAAIRYLYQHDFPSFLRMAFTALHPGTPYQSHWSLDVLCEALGRCERGECRRLIINMPPRSLKSFTASVALPAWALGRDPEKKIMCVAGHRGLADDQQELTQRLMRSAKYRSLFPHVRASESHGAIRLQQGGIRSAFTTTVPLTGRGADMIILDDPQRVGLDEADEERASDAAFAWYQRQVEQRLDSPAEGVIIVVMQRLSHGDLTARLMKSGDWEVLSIPMIAEEDERFPRSTGNRLVRRAGELLNPARMSRDRLMDLLVRVGARPFLAQYQQSPAAPGDHLGRGMHWSRLPLPLPEYLRARFPGIGAHGITLIEKDETFELRKKYFGWEPGRLSERKRLRHPTREEHRRIVYYEKLHDHGLEEAEAWIDRFPETAQEDRRWIAEQGPLPGIPQDSSN